MVQNRFAIIVAGGSGVRMESTTPKQFMLLKGLPVLMHTINSFYKSNPSPSIYLVLPGKDQARWKDLCQQHSFSVPHKIVSGGETRFHSVKNGLSAIEENGLVAIHDGVRPLVSQELIQTCYTVALQKGNAAPAVNPYETVRLGSILDNKTYNRDSCWLIQTPQVFNLKSIKEYYNAPWNSGFTDDASVAEYNGEKINIVEGERENIKITTPLDISLAEMILENVNKLL